MSLERALICTSVKLPSLRRKTTSIAMSSTSGDRKSTRLNSSHSQISYAVFCLKKKTHRVVGGSRLIPRGPENWPRLPSPASSRPRRQHLLQHPLDAGVQRVQPLERESIGSPET